MQIVLNEMFSTEERIEHGTYGTNKVRTVWVNNHDVINLGKTPTNVHCGKTLVFQV